MINHLDNLLRHLFTTQINEIKEAERQIRFQPPDADWRIYVRDLHVGEGPASALNVYLADVRENRKLRSNARTRTEVNGEVMETPAPRRVDCHYLITAWSPAAVSEALEPTLDEHALLYKTMSVLMHNEPLLPREIYGGALPSNLPAAFSDAELPTQILPVEGFPKLPEFWGAMGRDNIWRPAIYLVVTLPLLLPTAPAGHVVTTPAVTYSNNGSTLAAHRRYQIAGRVLDSIHLNPATQQPSHLVEASVRLETIGAESLQTILTDADGRFAFSGLAAGRYRLQASVRGFEPFSREIEVPSPSGEYDLRLT